MLLCGDDAARLLRSLHDKLRVKGLDGVHIDNAGGNTVVLQRLSSLHRLRHHDAGRDYRDVLAVAENSALAELEAVAGDLVGDDLGRGSCKAQIRRAVIVDERFDRKAHLMAVTGAAHQHAGQRAHEREVLDALMGRAVLADRNAAVRADYGAVEVRIRDGVSDLLIRAPRRKYGKGVRKGLIAAGRKPSRNIGHIGFGNAAVKESLGVRRGEELRHRRACKVGIQHDELRVLIGKLSESLAVGIACCYLSCHFRAPPVL